MSKIVQSCHRIEPPLPEYQLWEAAAQGYDTAEVSNPGTLNPESCNLSLCNCDCS